MKETWSPPKMERLSIAKVTKDQYWQSSGNSYWKDTHAGKNEPNNGYWNPPPSSPASGS